MNKNKIIGDFGEDLAVQYLVKNGYKIIARNVQMRHKELDIIASIKEMLVFVEVKTSTFNKVLAEDNMTRSKTKNLKWAISQYLYINRISTNNIRLDLVAIDVDKIKKIAKIKHFKDIF